MGTVGWLFVVALAIALGFGAGRFWPGFSAKITELERDRDAAREDLQNYRQDVNVHFARTAELFDKVTADYRGLYEHLALGARQLGSIRSESVAVPQVEPEQRRLARTGPGEAAGEPFIAEEPSNQDESPSSGSEADNSNPPVTAANAPPAPSDAIVPAEGRPAAMAAAADHPPPANDEEVEPREATTGR